MFKIGDYAKCVNINGWNSMRWKDKKPFRIIATDLEHIGNFPFDFIKVNGPEQKVIKPYGIVKFMEGK